MDGCKSASVPAKAPSYVGAETEPPCPTLLTGSLCLCRADCMESAEGVANWRRHRHCCRLSFFPRCVGRLSRRAVDLWLATSSSTNRFVARLSPFRFLPFVFFRLPREARARLSLVCRRLAASPTCSTHTQQTPLAEFAPFAAVPSLRACVVCVCGVGRSDPNCSSQRPLLARLSCIRVVASRLFMPDRTIAEEEAKDRQFQD